jgi:heme-degrading monooxygenase HmoA
MAASMEAISWTQENEDKVIELWAERQSLFNIVGTLPGTGSGVVPGKWLK